jgi:CheY-like chemotaxis protein
MTMEESRKPTIMLVEDDAAVRRVLGLMLEHAGFTVQLAGRGEAALELYQRQRDHVDLVLLDVHLPDQDGAQILQELRQLDANIRVVFISGNTGKYRREELIGMGAVCVLQKPPELAELRDVLWGLLGQPAPPASEPELPAGSSINRRGAVRWQPPLGTVCRLDPGEGHTPHLALVWNLSTNGVSLLVREPLARESVLPGELTAVDEQDRVPVTLQVVHVQPIRTGDYFLGAQFRRPLDRAELHSFLS